jgi:prophage maintenance system killer protein
MINLEDVALINKQFSDGKIRNQSGLQYALDQVKATEDWSKQLAHLLRAVVVENAFEDGNKQTAAYLVLKFASDRRASISAQKIYDLVIAIAAKRIADIRKLQRMVKNALI